MTATEAELMQAICQPAQFRQWCFPQQFSQGLPEVLVAGMSYDSWLGPIVIHHRVQHTEAHQLLMVLSGGIDGFHEFSWGAGWVQSRLEGISLLPLNLGQTYSLLRLRQFVEQPFPRDVEIKG